MDDILILDVGGIKFKTTKSTLKKYPDTYFTGLLNDKYPLLKQEDGSIFIDRDGKHFRLLLNFLRSGRIILPTDEIERRELLIEAEFYLLTDYILSTTDDNSTIESIEKNIHGAWESNLIFIGYKNIDFEQDDLREVRDVLATVQKPDTTEHVWKSIHDPGLTVIFQISPPTAQASSADFSLKSIGPLLNNLKRWNRPHLRFVLVYDAELIRELLKLSGEKFSNNTYVWYFQKGRLIECSLQWKLKYVAENMWKHYYLSIDYSVLQ
jgi:hypothetical protein